MQFPSAEWADALRVAVNANPAYAEAARAWEGDILFLMRLGDESVASPGVRLDLAHGECRAATYLADARETESEFVYEGSPEAWAKLFRHEVDPVQAILDGTFRIRGNLAKAMRFTRAAKELVESAASIPTDVVDPGTR